MELHIRIVRTNLREGVVGMIPPKSALEGRNTVIAKIAKLRDLSANSAENIVTGNEEWKGNSGMFPCRNELRNNGKTIISRSEERKGNSRMFLHRNRLPDNRLPDNRLPDNRLPDNRLPDNKEVVPKFQFPAFIARKRKQKIKPSNV